MILQVDIDKNITELENRMQESKPKKAFIKFLFILFIAFVISLFYSIGMAYFLGFFIFIFGMIFICNKFNNNDSKKEVNYHFVKFESNGLTIIKTFYSWAELKNIKINIDTYCDFHEDDCMPDLGWEHNYIEFEFDNNIEKYNIYINDEIEFIRIKKNFKETILPVLYKLKNIRRENLVIEKLDYSELQKFKQKNDINRLADDIHFNQ